MKSDANSELVRPTELRGALSATLFSVASVLRGMRLLVSGRPKTLLRTFCIMAFDARSMLRHSTRLPYLRLKTLAVLLDFGACANAAFDNKEFSRNEFRRTRQILGTAGVGSTAVNLLRGLGELERSRPTGGKEPWCFHKVVSYRESVVRLFLGTVAATASGNSCIEDGVQATYRTDDLVIFFRISMLCQIMDDVLDYPKDKSGGLPTFLTASESLHRAFELTRVAALGYADVRDLPGTGESLPLRVVLQIVSTCTQLIIFVGRWRHRNSSPRRFPESSPRLTGKPGLAGLSRK